MTVTLRTRRQTTRIGGFPRSMACCRNGSVATPCSWICAGRYDATPNRSEAGFKCQAPAVRGHNVCRMHGAAGGAPKGKPKLLIVDVLPTIRRFNWQSAGAKAKGVYKGRPVGGFDGARCLCSVDGGGSRGTRSRWTAPSMARPFGRRSACPSPALALDEGARLSTPVRRFRRSSTNRSGGTFAPRRTMAPASPSTDAPHRLGRASY